MPLSSDVSINNIFSFHSSSVGKISYFSLSKLLNHATVQQTTDYIGLTAQKNRKYINDHNDLIRNVLEGKGNEINKNTPVISLKTEDFGNIIMEVIKATDMSDVEKYQMAINLANELRVS